MKFVNKFLIAQKIHNNSLKINKFKNKMISLYNQIIVMRVKNKKHKCLKDFEI